MKVRRSSCHLRPNLDSISRVETSLGACGKFFLQRRFQTDNTKLLPYVRLWQRVFHGVERRFGENRLVQGKGLACQNG